MGSSLYQRDTGNWMPLFSLSNRFDGLPIFPIVAALNVNFDGPV